MGEVKSIVLDMNGLEPQEEPKAFENFVNLSPSRIRFPSTAKTYNNLHLRADCM